MGSFVYMNFEELWRSPQPWYSREEGQSLCCDLSLLSRQRTVLPSEPSWRWCCWSCAKPAPAQCKELGWIEGGSGYGGRGLEIIPGNFDLSHLSHFLKSFPSLSSAAVATSGNLKSYASLWPGDLMGFSQSLRSVTYWPLYILISNSFLFLSVGRQCKQTVD